MRSRRVTAGAHAVALGAALLLGCGERSRGAAPGASTASAGLNASAAGNGSADAASPGATPGSASASASAVAAPPPDPDEVYLATADIVSIVPVRGPLKRGIFDAQLAAPEGRRAATIAVALAADPNAYRRPLAFARLARALGARVAPRAVLRHVAAGDLAAIAGDAGDAVAIVKEARVLNDGTVDVLLSTRSAAQAGAEGRTIDPTDAREMMVWERWASSAEPLPGEDTGVLRDYVEMLALDYLSANDARRSVIVTGRGLVLADNASAFPPHPEKPMVDRALRRLRTAERFPRGLRDALAAFDRERAAATFAEGGFETWILTPRARIELDERRAALLTLIEAKIAARGEAAVLCL